ncbi:hypothetical protein [Beijerinckia sp. L45]|uniref:hypothetical protein n=1 Tax=Beijerinckia sp. L45 TaxID=1641855 RepID=UPI00131BA30C|nr:hypothetical protein [Beijerinckia sp. L45]
MANEKLILEAEVRDNMSAALRKIQKELNSIGATPGMKETNGWLTKLGKEADGFVKSGGGAAGVINSMGIGGLTAAASLAGMVAQFKELATQQLALKELGREIGMTTDQVNQFAHAGEHFGVAGDAMKGMLDGFAGLMPEFKRSTGDLFKEMSQWPEVIGRMQHEGIGDALLDGLRQAEEIAKAKGPQAQKRFLEHLFPGHGPDAEKLFSGGLGEFIKELESMKTKLAPISPEMLKQEQAMRDAVKDLNISLENFENKVGPRFLGMLTAIVEKAAQFFNPDGKAAKDQHDGGAADERKNAPDMDDERIKRALRTPQPYGALDHDAFKKPSLGDRLKEEFGGVGGFHKSSYEGSGGLLHMASYGGSGEGVSTSLAATIAAGTKMGFLAAFRELMAIQDADGKGGGQNISFGPQGGGGLGLGGGDGGHGGGGGGRGRRASREDGDSPRRPMDMDIGEPGDLTKLITQESKRVNIDPRIMEGMRAGESAHKGYYDYGDKNDGGAWGPLQFNMAKGRFGWQFKHDTGIDPTNNPKAIPAMIRYAAEFIARKLKKNPHYADGGNGSELHRVWHGFHGLREADPRWGNSGYVAHAKPDRLQPPPVAGRQPGKQDGTVRADIHVHGPAHKTSVQASGMIEAKLHRWSTMTTPSDLG